MIVDSGWTNQTIVKYGITSPHQRPSTVEFFSLVYATVTRVSAPILTTAWASFRALRRFEFCPRDSTHSSARTRAVLLAGLDTLVRNCSDSVTDVHWSYEGADALLIFRHLPHLQKLTYVVGHEETIWDPRTPSINWHALSHLNLSFTRHEEPNSLIMAVLAIDQLPCLRVFILASYYWLLGLLDFLHSKPQLQELSLHVLMFKPDEHLPSMPSLTKLGFFYECAKSAFTSVQPQVHTIVLYGVSHQRVLNGDSIVYALQRLLTAVKEVVAKETRMRLPLLRTVAIENLSWSEIQLNFTDDDHLRQLANVSLEAWKEDITLVTQDGHIIAYSVKDIHDELTVQ